MHWQTVRRRCLQSVQREVANDITQQLSMENAWHPVRSILLAMGYWSVAGASACDALVGWAMYGALHFPVSPPELFRLACLVLGMTVVTTLVMWLEGKWKGRW